MMIDPEHIAAPPELGGEISSNRGDIVNQAFDLEATIQYHQAKSVHNEALAKEWRDKALTDPLTKLGNRLALQEHLENNPGPRAVLKFDGDNFGAINKRFGDHAGDVAVIQMGTMLGSLIRPGVDQLFRMGGDEFMILLGQPDPHDLPEEFSESHQSMTVHPSALDRRQMSPLDIVGQLKGASHSMVERLLNTPEFEHLKEVDFGISFGKAIYQPGMSVFDLMKAADQDLREQKNAKLPEITPELQTIYQSMVERLAETNITEETFMKMVKAGVFTEAQPKQEKRTMSRESVSKILLEDN